MIGRLFHALLAASVVTAAAVAGSYGVTHWVPEGRARDLAEGWVTAPGQALYARLDADRSGRKKVPAGHQRIAEAGLDLKKLQDSPLGRDLLKATAQARTEAQRLMHLYNVGAWAGAGFLVCLVLTIFFGVSSIGSALVLGFQVSAAFIFLQGALILGGVLVCRKIAG